jgi:hypothetical protein
MLYKDTENSYVYIASVMNAREWSTGGMIATDKNQNTDREMCCIATLSNKSHTHTDL